jgi:type I restriction enzyme S subunit
MSPERPLGELCEFQRGLTYGKSDEVALSENVVLRANNIDLASNRFDFSELRYIDPSVEVPESKRVRPGALLICTASGSKSHLGKVAYVDSDYGYAFGGFMGQLVPVEGVDGRYLFHALTSPRYKSFIDKLSDGLNINNLKFDDLRRFQVSLPGLKEQRRIVAILDEAFEGIATAKAHAETNLRNAREVFESYAKGLFFRGKDVWPTKTLDQISTNLDYRRVPITKGDRKAGDFPYYGASGIVDYVDDYIFDGDALLVSEDGANLLARSTPIAFSVSGRYWVNNHAHILQFADIVTQRFVEYFLESIPLDEYITGAAQPKLNQRALNSIPIPIPQSLDEQARIVDRLNGLQEQTSVAAEISARKLAARACPEFCV